MATYTPRLQEQVRWDSSGDELQGTPAAHSCPASNPPHSASPFVGRRLWPCNGIFGGFSTMWQLHLTTNTKFMGLWECHRTCHCWAWTWCVFGWGWRQASHWAARKCHTSRTLSSLAGVQIWNAAHTTIKPHPILKWPGGSHGLQQFWFATAVMWSEFRLLTVYQCWEARLRQRLDHTVAERKPPLCLRPCIPRWRWFRKCCEQSEETKTRNSGALVGFEISSNSARRYFHFKLTTFQTTLKV